MAFRRFVSNRNPLQDFIEAKLELEGSKLPFVGGLFQKKQIFNKVRDPRSNEFVNFNQDHDFTPEPQVRFNQYGQSLTPQDPHRPFKLPALDIDPEEKLFRQDMGFKNRVRNDFLGGLNPLQRALVEVFGTGTSYGPKGLLSGLDSFLAERNKSFAKSRRGQ